METSQLKRVLSHLAYRYMNEESVGKNCPRECIDSMLDDISTGMTHIQEKTGCSVWVSAQNRAREMVRYDQRFAKDETKILKAEEISAIIEMGLHSHFGSPQINFSFEYIKMLMRSEINQSLGIKQIDENYLPNSLWIEIDGVPTIEVPVWMQKTVGILMTKIPLSETGKEKIALSVKNLPQWRYIYDMLKTLCECDGQCIAYTAIVAQKEAGGFRFTPTIFGYDESGTIEDMLLLHKDITQKRKYKDIERFTAELCLRAIITQETAPTYCRHA